MPGNTLRVMLIGRHELAHDLARRIRSLELPLAVLPATREDPARPGLGQLDLPGVTQFAAGQDVVGCARTFSADLVISAGFDRILSSAQIDALPPAINIHFGALPRYRGNLSIPWALMNGETEIGVTLHQIAPGIDDGAIFAQRLLPVRASDAAIDLYHRAVEAGIDLALDQIALLRRGETPEAQAQDEFEATYYPPSFPGHFMINWRQTLRSVRNYIRACHFPPYPSASSNLDGCRFEFAWPVRTVAGRPEARAGQIIQGEAGRAGIAVLNGLVLPGAVRCGDTLWTDFSAAAAELGLIGARFETGPSDIPISV